MNDFSQLNSAIQALVPKIPSDVLSGISSGIVRIGQKASAAISEYSSLYAQNQLLKYNENGDPSDVTTNDRVSVADSAIANAIREMTGIRDQYLSLMGQLPKRTATVTVSAAINSADRVIWVRSIQVGSYIREVDGYTVLLYIRVGFSIVNGKTSLVFRKEMESGNPPKLPPATYENDALLTMLGNVMFPRIAVGNIDAVECIPLQVNATVAGHPNCDLYLIPRSVKSQSGYRTFNVGTFFIDVGGYGVVYSSSTVTFEDVPFNTIMEWSQLPFPTSESYESVGGSTANSSSVTNRVLTGVGDNIALAPNPGTSGIIDTSIEVSHEFSESYVPNQAAQIDAVIEAMKSL